MSSQISTQVSGQVFKLKKILTSLPTITQFIVVAAFVAILIGCAYYIYKTYIAPQSDRSSYEGFASGMNLRNESSDPDMVTLYMFAVEWCPHCKHAKPIWDEFVKENSSKMFNGKNVNFVLVDCDKDSALADKYGVSGYPTIKLDKGSEVIEYSSKPSSDTLLAFLQNSV
jgi:thiol-disulfide isomerase/thioredoxin